LASLRNTKCSAVTTRRRREGGVVKTRMTRWSVLGEGRTKGRNSTKCKSVAKTQSERDEFWVRVGKRRLRKAS